MDAIHTNFFMMKLNISYMEHNDKNNNKVNNNEVKFDKHEEKFLLENEVCRIATSHNNTPHITPVAHIYENSLFFFTTDYNTRKFRNLKDNKNIALAVDVYNSSTKNKAVIIQGTADIIERGK